MDKCSCGSTNIFHNYEGFDCLDCGKYTADDWTKEENQ